MKQCPLCGQNQVDQWIQRNQEWICRACLPYHRTPSHLTPVIASHHHVLRLNFPLTPDQQRVSHQLERRLQHEHPQLLHAICGAGKTEIVAPLILHTLQHHHRVGFAIPRLALVRDIAYRLARMFPQSKVVAVYGGHHDDIEGDIVVFTTHQAARYHRAFHLLIIDEIDAFPYVGNPILHGLVHHTTVAHIIYLSATPPPLDSDRISRVGLHVRPHGHPQVVPRVIRGGRLYRWIHGYRTLRRWRDCRYPILIFVPTIALARTMFRYLPQGWGTRLLLYAGSPDMHRISRIIHERIPFIGVATTVMERGLTIPRVRVMVWDAHHPVFTATTLIQIAGRVGRTAPDFDGETLLYTPNEREAIRTCIQTIQHPPSSTATSVVNHYPKSNTSSKYS